MIRVECLPDSTLVQSLTGLTKKHIIHHSGKSEVCKAIKKLNDCVGMIDEDPGRNQPTYLQNLVVQQEMPDFNLRILLDEERNNKIIILCPNLEGWIIKSADEAGIDLNRENLSRDEYQLHQIINSRLQNFSRLIEKLKRMNSNRIRQLELFLKNQV